MVSRDNPDWARNVCNRLSREMPRKTQRAMLMVESEAKRIVYLGHEEGHLERQTGTLQRSITTETNVTEDDTIISTTGTNIEYAPTHEVGLTIKNASGGFSHFPARPFLQPAFSAKKEAVKEALQKMVKTILDDEATG